MLTNLSARSLQLVLNDNLFSLPRVEEKIKQLDENSSYVTPIKADHSIEYLIRSPSKMYFSHIIFNIAWMPVI